MGADRFLDEQRYGEERKLRAENEKLSGQLDRAKRKIRRLEQENARLREQLNHGGT